MTTAKLGFGCMRWPLIDPDDQSSFDTKQIEQMADAFIQSGFTYFDTAYSYHNEKSEAMLRKAVVERYGRTAFTVADKLPVWLLRNQDDQERLFREQLKRVGVTYFDYYLLHSLNTSRLPLLERLGTWGFLLRKKEEGLARQVGFSFHDDADTLDALLTKHPEVDFVQLQINYLDWENRKIQSRRNYETARRHGKKVIVMEPVKGGVLASLPQEAEAMLREREPDMSPASWAIRFSAGLAGVIVVLSGMSTLEQTQDNLSYMKNFRPLSQEDRDVLMRAGAIMKDARKIPCTACRYCVDGCPKHIAIPEYFALYNAEIGPEQGMSHRYNEMEVQYERLAKTRGKASDCITCGACEKACPQKIEIPVCLEKVKETFED